MEKKSFMKKLTGSREALLAVILVLLFVVITIISPSFLTFKSLTDMLKMAGTENEPPAAGQHDLIRGTMRRWIYADC